MFDYSKQYELTQLNRLRKKVLFILLSTFSSFLRFSLGAILEKVECYQGMINFKSDENCMKKGKESKTGNFFNKKMNPEKLIM